MALSPFFTVHSDLPREGPGLPEDVHWALELTGTGQGAPRICDIACGPGADIVTFANARPKARIDGIDLQPHFIEAARQRTDGFGPRIALMVGDYLQPPKEEYDLVWCAGAAYFAGFLNLMDTWRTHLVADGAIAFSEPVRVTDPATPEVLAFWDGYTPLRSVSEMSVELEGANWQVLGHRVLIGAPWAAYYDPMRARLDVLRSNGPDAALSVAIDNAAREIAMWEACPDQIAYALFVVRPA